MRSFVMPAGSAVWGALLILIGPSMLGPLQPYFPSLATTFTLAGYAVSGAVLLGVAFIGIAVVVISSEVDRTGDDDFDALGQLASIIRAGAVIGIVYILWTSSGDIGSLLWTVVRLLPFIIVGVFAFLYLERRREVTSAGPAMRRTQRDARRLFRGWAEALFGAVAMVFAVALAVMSGALDGLNQLGDPLLEFAGEAAYLFMSWFAYALAGGNYGGQYLPEGLNAFHVAGIALTIGAVVVLVGED